MTKFDGSRPLGLFRDGDNLIIVCEPHVGGCEECRGGLAEWVIPLDKLMKIIYGKTKSRGAKK